MDLITCFALCIPRAVGCIRGGTSKVKGLKQSPEEELSTNSLSFTSFPVLFRIIGFYIIVNHLEAHLSRTHLHNVTFKLVYLKQHSKFASLLESFHFFPFFFPPSYCCRKRMQCLVCEREKQKIHKTPWKRISQDECSLSLAVALAIVGGGQAKHKQNRSHQASENQ